MHHDTQFSPQLHPALRHRHFNVIDSTNACLMQADAPCNQLVSADRQTAGRGRRQQQWVDEGDSLLFSLSTAFSPDQDISAWSIQVAITLVETLKAFTQQRLFIKWPNDLYVPIKSSHSNDNSNNNNSDNKYSDYSEYGKCAGILVESNIGRSGKMVTGIGINLAPIHTKIDSDYAVAYLNIAVDKHSLLIALANELFWAWQDFLTHTTVNPDTFAAYDLLMDKQLCATDSSNGKETIGQGAGINQRGQLRILQHNQLLTLSTQQRIRLFYPPK